VCPWQRLQGIEQRFDELPLRCRGRGHEVNLLSSECRHSDEI
jgi:hypothetical protein